MNIYLTNKQSSSKVVITKENASELLRDGLKVAIFKTKDQVEIILFTAQDYYGDIISRESKGIKDFDNIGKKVVRIKPEIEKHFIGSGVLNLKLDADNIVFENGITRVADKRYINNNEVSQLDIGSIRKEVSDGLKQILDI